MFLRQLLLRPEMVGHPQPVQMEFSVAVAVFQRAVPVIMLLHIVVAICILLIYAPAVHVDHRFQLAVYGGPVVYLSEGIQTDPGAQLVVLVSGIYIVIPVDALHADFRQEIDISLFLFQLGHTHAQILQLCRIFLRQTVHNLLLLRGESFPGGQKLSDDFRHFIPGHILVAPEGSVRISGHHALLGQAAYSLIAP